MTSAEMSPLLPATPLDIPNMFSFWEDRQAAHPAEPLQHISLVHSSQDVPLHGDCRPGHIESRLELLQAQLSRWAGVERTWGTLGHHFLFSRGGCSGLCVQQPLGHCIPGEGVGVLYKCSSFSKGKS